MKRIRNLMLAALMALAATAAMGVASASASKIAASKYPANLTGAGFVEGEALKEHRLTTNFTSEISCGAGPSFTAELTASSSEMTATPANGKCFAAGSNSTLNMNGCKFIQHFGAQRPDGTFAGNMAIGPSGCGPITLQVLTCKISIPAQKGLAVSFANKGTGKVVQTAEITGMTYSQTLGTCGGQTGTFKNGNYTGQWSIAAGAGELQIEPTGSGFVAEEYPAKLGGFLNETQTLKFGPKLERELRCKSASFSGTLSTGSSSLSVTPAYAECTEVSTGFGTTIAFNGCAYAIHSYSNKVDIDCPAEKAVQVTFATCKLEIPDQAGLTAISLGGSSAITLDWSKVTGVDYKMIDGFLCPFQGSSEQTNGLLGGLSTINASNALGEPNSIWVD